MTNESEPLLHGNNRDIPAQRETTPVEDGHDGHMDSEEASHPKELTTGQLLIVMSGLYLGAFLAALDSTMVATLTAPILTSFDSLYLLSWLASAYFIASAASQPLSGKLTDIYGRRAGLIFCNVTFAIGNLVCALAPNAKVMILGRVVAGLGGGGLYTIATFVASDLVPLKRRGLWQGFANICFGLGSGIGGIFGGWMNDTFSWRWAFIVQIPPTFIAAALVIMTVRIPVKAVGSIKEKLGKIDVLGAILLLTALILMLIGLNSGGNIVPWNHPLVLSSLPLAAVSFIAFIWVDSRVSEPIIPVRLLLERTVLSACLTNWFITMARFGLLFYGPIYFQIQGYSATQAGLRLIPDSFGVAFMSPVSGIIMRWTGRYYVLNVVTEVIFVSSLGLVISSDLINTLMATIFILSCCWYRL